MKQRTGFCNKCRQPTIFIGKYRYEYGLCQQCEPDFKYGVKDLQ